MNITPSNIWDWKDRELRTNHGHLVFRLFASGWTVRFNPYAGEQVKVEDTDIWNACAFANYHIGQ